MRTTGSRFPLSAPIRRPRCALARACGTPVIAHRIEPFSELVENNFKGLLVPGRVISGHDVSTPPQLSNLWAEAGYDLSTGAYAFMQSVNPAVIPQNHRVEQALSAAEKHDDLSVLHRLLAALESPYEVKADRLAEYRNPPADEAGYRTLCGT